MSYQVPQNIDPNKIFLVNRSEIEGRLDPSFYTKHFLEIIDEIKKCKRYNRLYQIARFSSEYWNQKDMYENEFPYIEIGALNIEDGRIEEVAYIPIENAPSRAKVIVRTNDIIVSTTRPNRGAIVRITKEEDLFIASTGFSVIREIDSSVNPDYLYIVLRLGFVLEQLSQRSTGGNYPAITQEELGKVFIPIPSLTTQQKIVDYYNAAYNKKRQKDLQANTLLDSIDDYLLGELGIKLPETKSQILQDRIFTVNISEIRDGRMDPKSVLFLGEHAKSEKYENTQLKQIATIVKGDSITSDNVNKDGQYPVIAGGQTSPYNHDKYNFKGDVITVSASGAYSGYVWYHDNPVFASDCSVIHSKNSQFLTKYLFEVLKAQQSLIYLLQQGAGQPHVYPDDLGQLWIPVVSLSKQQEIVAHISEMRAQAKKLQAEGAEILQKAKTEVERMILG